MSDLATFYTQSIRENSKLKVRNDELRTMLSEAMEFLVGEEAIVSHHDRHELIKKIRVSLRSETFKDETPVESGTKSN